MWFSKEEEDEDEDEGAYFSIIFLVYLVSLYLAFVLVCI